MLQWLRLLPALLHDFLVKFLFVLLCQLILLLQFLLLPANLIPDELDLSLLVFLQRFPLQLQILYHFSLVLGRHGINNLLTKKITEMATALVSAGQSVSNHLTFTPF